MQMDTRDISLFVNLASGLMPIVARSDQRQAAQSLPEKEAKVHWLFPIDLGVRFW
jgi:hypothetical protein